VTSPIGCTLYVDGVRVADGHPGEQTTAPAALTGLSVNWGRETTVDQVEPSTCTFDVMDAAGGGSFLSLLYTGARVDVVADGTVPGTGNPVNLDGGFELAAAGSTPPWANITGTAKVTAAQAHTGAQAASLATTATGFAGANIPPAPPSTDPTAWDHVPTVQAGQAWTVSAWVQVPPGGTFSRSLVLFTRPNDVGAVTGAAASTSFDPAAPTWHQISIPWTAPASAAGKWLGLRIAPAAGTWKAIHGYPATTPWTGVAGSWADWATGYVDDVQFSPPDAATRRDVTVFSGRITDLDAGWSNDTGTVVCAVIAADFTADLAQRDVGAAPWPAETLAARFARIVAAAHVTVPYTIDPTLKPWVVSWLDVDRQACWDLLADLATSVDGVLWSATHRVTGPYLHLWDPRTGSALYVLAEGDDGLIHISGTDALDAAIALDACDVLLEPVAWKQAVSDVSTRVKVGWQEQTVDEGGLPAPTDQTEVIVDAALEVRLGTRAANVATLLTTSSDAQAIGLLLLARLRLQSWRVSGLVWLTQANNVAMTADQVGRALDLLDGTRRLAAPILLDNLPAWAPTPSGAASLPLLLQGGTYTFDDGGWALNMTTSSAAAQGSSLAWQDVDPAWAWNEFDKTIDWADLVGVAAP
jgi:hypothetical protein